jgi:hypothetical protein
VAPRRGVHEAGQPVSSAGSPRQTVNLAIARSAPATDTGPPRRRVRPSLCHDALRSPLAIKWMPAAHSGYNSRTSSADGETPGASAGLITDKTSVARTSRVVCTTGADGQDTVASSLDGVLGRGNCAQSGRLPASHAAGADASAPDPHRHGPALVVRAAVRCGRRLPRPSNSASRRAARKVLMTYRSERPLRRAWARARAGSFRRPSLAVRKRRYRASACRGCCGRLQRARRAAESTRVLRLRPAPGEVAKRVQKVTPDRWTFVANAGAAAAAAALDATCPGA